MLFRIITNCASTLLMVLSNLSNLSNLSMFEKVLNWGGMFGCLFLILVDSFISKVVIVVIVVIVVNVVNAVTYVHAYI